MIVLVQEIIKGKNVLHKKQSTRSHTLSAAERKKKLESVSIPADWMIAPYVFGTDEVLKVSGLSLSTLRRLIRENKIKPPFRQTERKLAWLSTDIAAWLKSRPEA